MEITGKVKVVTEELSVSQSYTKRELVVTTDEQYPQTIMIEFGQGKCNEYLDKLTIGDEVKVSINLGGREWVNPQGETKYFNSIKGWKVEKIGSTPVAQTAPVTEFAPAQKQPEGQVPDAEESDFPF